MSTNQSSNLISESSLTASYDAIAIEPKQASSREEFKYITTASVPLVISFLLQYMMSVTSVFACGQLGATELAAASLAICTFNITGLSIYQGMATSLDALCSQAFGFQKYSLVGVYFQRCSASMMTLTVVILLPMWWWSGHILSHIIADQNVVSMTQLFLRYHCIGAPALLLFETGKRYLQAQHIFNASTYILAVVVPLNYVLNWLLVWNPTTALGFVGAPIAISISYWITALLMLAYAVFVDGKRCWNGFCVSEVFSGWSPILKLALPGIVMVEAEYLAFEVLTILAAAFGTEALAAQAIAANIGTLAYQLPFAISVALSTRIGNLIGKGHVDGAKEVSVLAVYVAFGMSMVNFSWVYLGRGLISRVFTKDDEVLAISEYIMKFVAVNQLFDAVNVIAAGLLRGQGRQRVGLYLNLVAYYVIALPVAYCMAYRVGLGLPGLWVGLLTGVFCLAVSEMAAVYVSDWAAIVEVLARVHNQE